MTRLLLGLAVLAGCAVGSSVRVQPNGAGVAYESSRARLTDRDMGGALGVRNRLYWQASAACAEPGCVPETVEIAFVNGSDYELDVDPRQVEIGADGLSRTWTNNDVDQRRVGRAIARGEFFRVTVSRDEFERIARSDDVRVRFGLTGTSPFESSLVSRAPFRDLAAALAAR